MDRDIAEILPLVRQKDELLTVMAVNVRSSSFGLVLTQEEAGQLVEYKEQTLKRYQRIEFGNSILEQLVETFCGSLYLDSSNYLESLERLTDIFYEFKNLTEDQVTDEELLHFMQEQFETVCYGDLDYLESTCLDRFAEAVRGGYRGYHVTDGRREYGQFSQEERWDAELYMEALRDLC